MLKALLVSVLAASQVHGGGGDDGGGFGAEAGFAEVNGDEAGAHSRADLFRGEVTLRADEYDDVEGRLPNRVGNDLGLVGNGFQLFGNE